MAKDLETLQAECAEAFAEQFMKPDIEHGDFFRYETDDGTFYVPAEFFDADALKLDEDRSSEVTFLKGYFGARLSAPGYVDCTEWVAFKDEAAAYRYLLETYGE